MTHAYQEIYLSNAQALLGDAFDYAINACGVAGDSFIKLFSVSSVSNRIENGEPSYLLGKSGIETAVDVLVETTGKAPPSLKRISAVPESIGSAGQSPTINGSPEESSVIFLRFFRLKICSRCIPPFMKRMSLNSLILSMLKCANTSLIPTSSVSARFMAARRQSLPSEAMSVFAQFKCTNSATRTLTKPVRRLFLALQKSSAVRWRIFWKRKSVTKRVVFPLKNYMNCGNVIAVKGKP